MGILIEKNKFRKIIDYDTNPKSPKKKNCTFSRGYKFRKSKTI